MPCFYILDGTLNSDVARWVLLKFTSVIAESTIELISLAWALVEDEVISEDVYKIVRDKEIGHTGAQYLDLILGNLKDHVKLDANSFQIFLDILRDDSLSQQGLTDKLC